MRVVGVVVGRVDVELGVAAGAGVAVVWARTGLQPVAPALQRLRVQRLAAVGAMEMAVVAKEAVVATVMEVAQLRRALCSQGSAQLQPRAQMLVVAVL